MIITSTAFTSDSQMPSLYTCEGKNISPSLTFIDLPEKAKSLVLFLEDTDATPIPWVHWLVFDIPAVTTEVPEGFIPAGGVEGLANNKSFGYEGPCPKYFSGTHRYRFVLTALDIELDLPAESDKDTVMQKAEGHIITQAELPFIQEGTLQA